MTKQESLRKAEAITELQNYFFALLQESYTTENEQIKKVIKDARAVIENRAGIILSPTYELKQRKLSKFQRRQIVLNNKDYFRKNEKLFRHFCQEVNIYLLRNR